MDLVKGLNHLFVLFWMLGVGLWLLLGILFGPSPLFDGLLYSGGIGFVGMIVCTMIETS